MRKRMPRKIKHLPLRFTQIYSTPQELLFELLASFFSMAYHCVIAEKLQKFHQGEKKNNHTTVQLQEFPFIKVGEDL